MQTCSHFHVFVLAIDVVFFVGLEALGELPKAHEVDPFLNQQKFRVLPKQTDAVLALEYLGEIEGASQVSKPVEADHLQLAESVKDARQVFQSILIQVEFLEGVKALQRAQPLLFALLALAFVPQRT